MAGEGSPATASSIESEWVETPVGKVEVKFAVPAGRRPLALALMVHGMSPSPEIIWEWGFLIEPLRQRKLAVVCPNLHSCDATSPKLGSPQAVVRALEAIVAWALGQVDGGLAVPVLVYGKSWGGAVAIQFCSGTGKDRDGEGPKFSMAGMVLACPSTRMEDREAQIASLSVPIFLAWAKDDTVLPFEQCAPLDAELRRRTTGVTICVSVEVGGHRIDLMAAGDEGLASRLVDWPDLALGPLAKLGSAALPPSASKSGSGAAEAAAEAAAETPAVAPTRAGAFDLSGMM